MKSFIVALAVFVSIAVFVTFSAITVSDGCGAMLKTVEKLPESVDDERFGSAYGEIADEWGELRASVRYFVGHTESDTVDDALDDIKARHDNGDASGYCAARLKLISALVRIKDSEEFKADTLF